MLSSLLLLAIFLSAPAFAGKGSGEGGECFSAFQIVNDSTPGRYDVNDGDFFVSAEVMPTEAGFLGEPVPGRRTLSLNLSLKNRHRRSQLQGREEFNKVLDHFAGKFDQIQGAWIAPQDEGELSTNLDLFNTLTIGPNALSPKEAALKTWTGQQAAAAGYTEVVVQKLEGEAGRYGEVTVLFRKPK